MFNNTLYIIKISTIIYVTEREIIKSKDKNNNYSI